MIYLCVIILNYIIFKIKVITLVIHLYLLHKSYRSIICLFILNICCNFRPSICFRQLLTYPWFLFPLDFLVFPLVFVLVLKFVLRLYWKNFVNGLFLFQWIVLYSCCWCSSSVGCLQSFFLSIFWMFIPLLSLDPTKLEFYICVIF